MCLCKQWTKQQQECTTRNPQSTNYNLSNITLQFQNKTNHRETHTALDGRNDINRLNTNPSSPPVHIK